MLKAVSVKAAGAWSGHPVDIVVLDAAERTGKSPANDAGARIVPTVNGQQLEIAGRNLPNVRTGDVFVTDSGALVEVVGKPEMLMEVRPASDADRRQTHSPVTQ